MPLLIYEVVQGGHHEECLLLQENIMRDKQERTKESKQQAGTGIWRCGMPKNIQKQQHKKVARNKRNKNWQGSRRNDVEAVNQLFRANEVEIKQKMLEALRLLRQADHTSQHPIVNLRQFIVNAQFVLFLTTINFICTQ
jgi:hypothetical protein